MRSSDRTGGGGDRKNAAMPNATNTRANSIQTQTYCGSGNAAMELRLSAAATQEKPGRMTAVACCHFTTQPQYGSSDTTPASPATTIFTAVLLSFRNQQTSQPPRTMLATKIAF